MKLEMGDINPEEVRAACNPVKARPYTFSSSPLTPEDIALLDQQTVLIKGESTSEGRTKKVAEIIKGDEVRPLVKRRRSEFVHLVREGEEIGTVSVAPMTEAIRTGYKPGDFSSGTLKQLNLHLDNNRGPGRGERTELRSKIAKGAMRQQRAHTAAIKRNQEAITTPPGQFKQEPSTKLVPKPKVHSAETQVSSARGKGADHPFRIPQGVSLFNTDLDDPKCRLLKTVTLEKGILAYPLKRGKRVYPDGSVSFRAVDHTRIGDFYFVFAIRGRGKGYLSVVSSN